MELDCKIIKTLDIPKALLQEENWNQIHPYPCLNLFQSSPKELFSGKIFFLQWLTKPKPEIFFNYNGNESCKGGHKQELTILRQLNGFQKRKEKGVYLYCFRHLSKDFRHRL